MRHADESGELPHVSGFDVAGDPDRAIHASFSAWVLTQGFDVMGRQRGGRLTSTGNPTPLTGLDSNSWGNEPRQHRGRRITPRKRLSRRSLVCRRCPRRFLREAVEASSGRASRAGGRPRFGERLLGFLDVDPMILIKSDHLLNDVVALPVAGDGGRFYRHGDHPVGDPGEAVADDDVDLGCCDSAREFLDPAAWRRKWSLPRIEGVGDPEDGGFEPAISLGGFQGAVAAVDGAALVARWTVEAAAARGRAAAGGVGRDQVRPRRRTRRR